MSDPRYDKISELFVNYSNGNFDFRVELSDELDEIDAFISSVNMLGEELKEITISKEFFNNVFDSVSDLVFVLDLEGNITKFNKAVFKKIRIDEEELLGMPIDILFSFNSKSFFKESLKKLSREANYKEFNSSFYYAKRSYPSLCTLNKLFSENNEQIGYTLIVKDLSNLKHAEEMVKLSEEKYRNLFEESGDAIIVSNPKGGFLEINSAGRALLGIDTDKIGNFSFYNFLHRKEEREKVMEAFREKKTLTNYKVNIQNRTTKKISNCLLTITKISVVDNYQIILKDITHESELENLMFRTIVNTQENERIRFAQDIHDGLGQQLSAIKFYLSTLSSTKQLSPKNQELLERSEVGLNNILANLREICFNLMPKTIENFGLIPAVNELVKNIEIQGKLQFVISAENKFPRLESQKEIALFRIIQEFINNTLKHSGATQINITFKHNNREILVQLKDNGKGFNQQLLSGNSGMGLKNVITRAKSHNGHLNIASSEGVGTRYEIVMPLKLNEMETQKQYNYD